MDQAEGIQNIAPTDANTQGQAAPEKMLKQSEVNELLFRLKHEAYEKGKRDSAQAVPQAPAQPAQTMGGMPQLTEEQVRQMIADEARKQNEQAAVQNVLSNFVQQMGSGKGKYSDFDETVANLGNLQNISHVVELATGTGMAGDVMYELGKNPGKVASLTTLAYINPHLAKVEMQKLADSIKTNDQAKESPIANEPLSQVKPSTVGTDTGSRSVRDLRKRYRA